MYFGVNFILQKFCMCKKNDKYEVWVQVSLLACYINDTSRNYLVRYFCGTSNTCNTSVTSDTSNTANSSDASNTSASVT